MRNLLSIISLLLFINVIHAQNDFSAGIAIGSQAGVNDEGSLKTGYGLNFHSDFFSDNILSFSPGITMYIPVESIKNRLFALKLNSDLHLNLSKTRTDKFYFLTGLTFNYVSITLMDYGGGHDEFGVSTHLGVGLKLKRFNFEIRKDYFMDQIEFIIGIATY